MSASSRYAFSSAMRSDRFFWRAFFGILLGLALAVWLWIMFEDFV